MSERQRLIAGYLRRMRARRNKKTPQTAAGSPDFNVSPHSLVISCFESMPAPELIFNTSQGEILQHHELGALMAPYDSRRCMDPYGALAKLEYAIEDAGVKNLVVLGNTSSKCLSYLVDGTEHPALSGWLEIAHNAMERARYKSRQIDGDALKKEILHQTVLQSVRNLLTYPVVYKAVKRGAITLNAWYYQPEEDLLYAYNPETQEFEKIGLPEEKQCQPCQKQTGIL